MCSWELWFQRSQNVKPYLKLAYKSWLVQKPLTSSQYACNGKQGLTVTSWSFCTATELGLQIVQHTYGTHLLEAFCFQHMTLGFEQHTTHGFEPSASGAECFYSFTTIFYNYSFRKWFTSVKRKVGGDRFCPSDVETKNRRHTRSRKGKMQKRETNSSKPFIFVFWGK